LAVIEKEFQEYLPVRITFIVLALLACSFSAQSNSPPSAVHVANSSDQVLTIWINGEGIELSPQSTIRIPCLAHEQHSVQTVVDAAVDTIALRCGESLELGR
jgi:hypothetical protein